MMPKLWWEGGWGGGGISSGLQSTLAYKNLVKEYQSDGVTKT